MHLICWKCSFLKWLLIRFSFVHSSNFGTRTRQTNSVLFAIEPIGFKLHSSSYTLKSPVVIRAIQIKPNFISHRFAKPNESFIECKCSHFPHQIITTHSDTLRPEKFKVIYSAEKMQSKLTHEWWKSQHHHRQWVWIDLRNKNINIINYCIQYELYQSTTTNIFKWIRSTYNLLNR